VLTAPPGLRYYSLSGFLQANPAQKALAALHSKPLPGCKMDGAGFEMYHELEQCETLKTIILLNVVACITKDLSTAD